MSKNHIYLTIIATIILFSLKQCEIREKKQKEELRKQSDEIRSILEKYPIEFELKNKDEKKHH